MASLADVYKRQLAACAPQLIAAAVTVGLHLWKHSTLLSIAGGTACYMVLIRVIV